MSGNPGIGLCASHTIFHHESNEVRMPKRLLLLTAVALCAAACAKTDTEDGRANLTERQKDSLIARSPIPGAKAVQKSLNVADSAAARQARLDSAQQNP
jgi:hypothetical protein